MMPTDTTADFDFVLQNPANYYRWPDEILHDPQLADDERVKLLEEWQMDINNKLTADEEGMIPAHAHDSAKDAVLLEQIAAARDQIDLEQPKTGVFAALNRLWHRL